MPTPEQVEEVARAAWRAAGDTDGIGELGDWADFDSYRRDWKSIATAAIDAYERTRPAVSDEDLADAVLEPIVVAYNRSLKPHPISCCGHYTGPLASVNNPELIAASMEAVRAVRERLEP